MMLSSQDKQYQRQAVDASRLAAAKDELFGEQQAHGRSKRALADETARGQHLQGEVLSIQDHERDRFARDLHDGVSQELTAATFLLAAFMRRLETLVSDATLLQTGRNLQAMLAYTSEGLRGLAHGLSSHEVGARGEHLGRALETLAGRINADGDVRCVAVCAGAPECGATVATNLYRIAQEALNNPLRHGQAKWVEISLAHAGGSWRLSIEDDGIGVVRCDLKGRSTEAAQGRW